MSKEISLVLGGGACKGFIHLGVYRYLEEKGYNIQEIAGTSMGAIIGAMIAAGKTYDEIYACAKSLNYKKLIDKNLSQGLIQGKKIMQIVGELIKVTQFNQLNIPLSVTATDIRSGECIVCTSGNIEQAVRGSISLPGLFSVHKHDNGHYLIDGGLVNNLPVNLIKNNQNIIAVSCLGLDDYTVQTSTSIFGREIDTSFFTLGSRVLYRSLDIMMTTQENNNINQSSNVTLIRPPLNGINPFSLGALDKAIEIGYNEAKRILGQEI